MYFQSLKNIENDYNDDANKLLKDNINNLDTWLASLPRNIYHRLNPLQFSLDYKLREEVAILLFKEALDVGLLDVYYEIISDDGLEVLNTYSKYEDIDKNQYSDIHDKEINISNNNIYMWFILKEYPNLCMEENVNFRKKSEAPPFGIKTVNNEKLLLDLFNR